MVKTLSKMLPVILTAIIMIVLLSAGANALDTDYDESDMLRIETGASSTVKNITMRYDDIYSLSSSYSGYTVKKIYNTTVTSQAVQNGKLTGSPDKEVVAAYNSAKTALIATGTGTTCANISNGSNTITLNITVKPATLTAVYAGGQSNMEGLCITFDGDPDLSVVCSRQKVYSVYAGSNESLMFKITGLSDYPVYMNNEKALIPGHISGKGDVTSINGNKLFYPLYSLSSDGDGKSGPDSGFAYEWNRLTGDKVYFVNAAVSSSSVKEWQKGETIYERAARVYTYAKQVYDAEIQSNHFKRGHVFFLWLQGESNECMRSDEYGKYFNKCTAAVDSIIDYDQLGIILARTLHRDTDEPLYHSLRITGTRNYQSYITRQDNNIFMASAVNELWITDSETKTYFINKYSKGITYPLRVKSSSVTIPTTALGINDGYHYSQIAHNENGITAAYNLYKALYGGIDPKDYYWIAGNGEKIAVNKTLSMAAGGECTFALRSKISTFTNGITYKYDSDYLSMKDLEETFIPKKSGTTKIGVYKDDVCLFEQKVNITDCVTPYIHYAKTCMEGINVKWSKASNDSVKYRLFYKNGSSWKTICTVNSLSYTWENAEPGKTYTFTVRCVDDSGNFISSYDKDGCIFNYQLNVPWITGVQRSGIGIKISWKKINKAPYYRVYYKNGDNWSSIGVYSGTSCTWYDGVLGKKYLFTVRCENRNGDDISGYDDEGYEYNHWLNTPNISSVVKSGSGIKITWGKISDSPRYKVFYKNGSSWKTIANVTGTSYTWSAGTYGEEYIFTVRCVSSSGGYISDFNSKGYTFSYLTETPKISKVETVESGVRISWSKITGASRYKIFYKTETSWKTIGNVTGTTFTWNEGVPGAEYVFTVRCANSSGSYISAYDKNGYNFIYPLETPKISDVVKDNGNIIISWGEIKDAPGYKLFYKTSSSWKTIANVSGTFFMWEEGVPGTEYVFTVRCVNDEGKYISGYDSKGYTFNYVFDTPYITEAANDSRGIKISWECSDSSPYYKVFYKTDTSWKTIAFTKDKSFIWEDAVAGTEYVFTVRCANSSGKYISGFDKNGYTFSYILETPVINSVIKTDDGITISWGEISRSPNYKVFYKTETSWKTIGNVSGTSFTWKDAEPYTDYVFTVRCADSSGKYISGYDKNGYTFSYIEET